MSLEEDLKRMQTFSREEILKAFEIPSAIGSIIGGSPGAAAAAAGAIYQEEMLKMFNAAKRSPVQFSHERVELVWPCPDRKLLVRITNYLKRQS